MSFTEHFLKPEEVARILGVKVTTLRDWRYRGTGPVYTRLSRRMVRYPASGLETYLSDLREVRACR